MDKNMDFNNFSPYGQMGYDMNFDPNMQDPILNPMMQYEQGYMYYRYLNSQLDYKIKCREYENMCKPEKRMDRRVE